MPEIPEIGSGQIRNIGITINEIGVNSIPVFDPSKVNSFTSIPPPVTVNIGSPIVDVPGCVEAHEQNSKREKSGVLSEDDPKGVKTYCDGQMPSFNPIRYEPDKMVFREENQLPVTKTDSPKPPTPEVPKAKGIEPVATAAVECPTKVQQAQEPVGTLVEGFRKKVTGYELIDKTCVQITEPVSLPTRILAGLPSGGQVMQVGGIAVIATSSALLAKPLADLLLKAVKPAVKKVMKKIAKLRGKKPPILSSGERRAEQRQMNEAVRVLRSVFPRKKKKL